MQVKPSVNFPGKYRIVNNGNTIADNFSTPESAFSALLDIVTSN